MFHVPCFRQELAPGIWIIHPEQPGRSLNPLTGTWSTKAWQIYHHPTTVVLRTNEYGLLVLDPGLSHRLLVRDRIRHIREIEKDTGLRVGAIGVTHGHIDHYAAVNALGTHLPVLVGDDFAVTEMTDPNGTLRRAEARANAKGTSLFPTWQHGIIFRVYRQLTYGRVGHVAEERFQPFPRLLHCGVSVIEIRPAPGHCPDEVMLWDTEHNILIVGDIFGTTARRTATPGAYMPEANVYDMLETLDFMAQIKPDILVVAHGLPILGRGNILATIATVRKNLVTIIRSGLEAHYEQPSWSCRRIADWVFRSPFLPGRELPEISQQERLVYVASAIADKPPDFSILSLR